MTTTTTKMTASMLELPRELYLIICDYLTPYELSQLAGVSKDHYMAVQQPLYANIEIHAFDKLVKLVSALTKQPVVSNISAKQRRRWQSLSDAQLRERDIKHLLIELDSKTNPPKQNVLGMHLSQFIGAISRNCDSVKIQLTLLGSWMHLLSQLKTVALPDVRKLVMCLDCAGDNSKFNLDRQAIWDLCFSGSSFPDLKEVELDTIHTSPEDRPETLNEAAKLSSAASRYYYGSSSNFMPFYALKSMESIKLKFNDTLNVEVLGSLFGSGIIPQHLTTLDISYCPSLSFTRDLGALSMLLQRGLQLLQHLKLHLCKLSHSWDWDNGNHKYISDITEHPDWHLCNVVREAGQNIKSLDLALPYACSRMFLPRPKKPSTAHPDLDYPTIPREPYDTLTERLLAAGYKHRRLILWHGTCRDNDEWDDILSLASDQGSLVSWEIVNADNKLASWHVGDCLPLTYKSRDVVKRALPLPASL